MATHAALPFALPLGGDLARIYFTCRNSDRRSHGACLTLNLSTLQVQDVSSAPLLIPGKPGYFDDCGTLITQVIEHGHQHRAYYVGWSERVSVPFQNAIGMATSHDGITGWQKSSDAPLIDRSHHDPLNLSYPWIRIEDGVWRMWYGSHLAWEQGGLDMLHVIKYAESQDGTRWTRTNHVCIPLAEGESGVSRPCVLKSEGIYHMWYSVRLGRKQTYRLGYATSADGLDWQRRDEHPLAHLPHGLPFDWDSEMICYPHVFDHNGRRFMLYNGNGFGRTGFGLAVWQ